MGESPRDPWLLAFGECMVERHEGGPTLDGLQYGGDTLTPLVAAARQGVPTGYITQLGRDDGGRALMDAWASEGVETRHVSIVEGFTGSIVIRHGVGPGEDAHGPLGAKPFEYHRAGSAASRYRPEQLPRDAIAAARMVFTSGISQALSAPCRDTVVALVGHARRSGVQVAYDPNYRSALATQTQAREHFESVASGLDLLTCGFPQEARLVLGDGGAADLAERAFARGIGLVVFRREQGGVWASRPGRTPVEVPRRAVAVVDASGAGDAFTGGLLAGLLRGEDLSRAVTRGILTATEAIQKIGTVTALPTGAAVETLLQESTHE